ncbi:hypothetical protein ACWD4E_41860, partial [Streptomyces sp. NPDC002540]
MGACCRLWPTGSTAGGAHDRTHASSCPHPAGRHVGGGPHRFRQQLHVGARRCHATTTRAAMMPMPRPAAVPETTTGSWRPAWSPGHTRPGLPPLTVVHDSHDDYAFMAAALAARTPALGRITVHPTPVASAPASLAHDLLRSLGKHLLLAGSEDGTYWTGNTETAWRAVAAWIFALRIGHVIVTRTHRISSRHFEHLFALRELTGIRLTLLCHGPLPPAVAAALTVLPHEEAHTLAAARLAVAAPALAGGAGSSRSGPRCPRARRAGWPAAGCSPQRSPRPGGRRAGPGRSPATRRALAFRPGPCGR